MSVWDDLQGQPAVVEQLRQAARGEGLTHAWLFTGPPGSGRSNAAKAFASALNCDQEDVGLRGCGQCQACHTILGETHSDVTFVRTEKVTITIDEARELVATAGNRPSSARWRIIVVEDADRMAERTTNVLLKAIEEPTPRTVWMLCAPSPADVLVTIRSRCGCRPPRTSRPCWSGATAWTRPLPKGQPAPRKATWVSPAASPRTRRRGNAVWKQFVSRWGCGVSRQPS